MQLYFSNIKNMSFYSELNLDGQQFKVLHCKYGFTQNINENQRTITKPEGGLISLVIEAQLGDGAILGWMLSNTMKKGGAIKLLRDSMATSFKTIAFSGAYCIAYKEDFDHNDEENLTISFAITSEEVSINGLIHKNAWK